MPLVSLDDCRHTCTLGSSFILSGQCHKHHWMTACSHICILRSTVVLSGQCYKHHWMTECRHNCILRSNRCTNRTIPRTSLDGVHLYTVIRRCTIRTIPRASLDDVHACIYGPPLYYQDIFTSIIG